MRVTIRTYAVNNVLLNSSIFTKESSIGCLDIIEHKWFFSLNSFSIM